MPHALLTAGFVLRAIRSDWIRIFHLIRRRPTDLNCAELLYERGDYAGTEFI